MVIIVIVVEDVNANDLILFEVVVDVKEFVKVGAQVVEDGLRLTHSLPVYVFLAL